MAFMYYKYRTDYGNTIISASTTTWSLGPNEQQLFVDYDIPAVQPLYMYYVNASNVLPNNDGMINTWLKSIGKAPQSVLFTGYTATTEARISSLETSATTFLKKTTFNTFTGTTLPATYETKSHFNTFTGTTLPANYPTKVAVAFYTGTTAPGQFAPKPAFFLYTGTTAPAQFASKANFNLFTGTTAPATYEAKSHFNAYSAATQITLNGKLNTSDFNVYSGATLALIQSSQAGLDPKKSVFVATTVDIGASYNAAGGTAGTGQFTSAPTTIDGRSVTIAGLRILVKNQSDPKQNGIYVVISSGVWNRATDMDGSDPSEVSAGNFTFVETGNTLSGSGWVVIGSGQLTLNTDPIVWTRFNSATAYIAGVGITIVGQTIAFDGANVAGNALSWSGTQLHVVPTGGTLGTAFNTKVDKTTFNTYTGTTAPGQFASKTNFNTYTGVTAPATFASKTNFNTFTGVTAPATYALKTNFNLFTGTTAPATYVLKSIFNSFTANTAIQTANNGLTKNGINVRLGGALTGNTTITTATGSRLNIAGWPMQYATDLSANFGARSLIDKGYATGGTFVTTANNGLTKNGANARLGGTLTGNTTITTATGSRLIIAGWPMQYATDLSANFGARSLIDKGYATGGTFVMTANNGLTKNGANARLGGTLTGATTITSPGTGSRLSFAGFPVQYTTDVSANYNSRSLMDYGYYTGNTLQTNKQALIYSSGTTDINVTTPIAIPFNKPVRNNVAFYTYTGGTSLRILTAGTYDVSYSVPVSNSNGTAHSVAASIYKNGTILPETTTAATLEGATSSGGCLALNETQLTFAANDVIQVRGYRLIAGGGSVNIVANSTFISIIKKY